jgi:DNA-binding GntR family transcriptional regulator
MKLFEHLHQSIEEEIASGRLPPGYRLDEAELARRLGVSRTPIREAPRSLLGEGLLEVQRKLRPYCRLQLHACNRPQRSLAEQQTILGAPAAGNIDLAVQSVRNHVMVQGERFADLTAAPDQMAAHLPELDVVSA